MSTGMATYGSWASCHMASVAFVALAPASPPRQTGGHLRQCGRGGDVFQLGHDLDQRRSVGLQGFLQGR